MRGVRGMPLRVMRAGASPRRWALGATLLGLSACVLEDVAITDPEDVVVAEVLVQLRDDGGASPNRPRVFALLHRTPGPEGSTREVPGARVVIQRADGPVVLTERERLRDCVVDTPESYDVSCYRASTADENRFRSGDELSLQIDLPGGGRLLGHVLVPGDFRLIDAPASRICTLAPNTPLEIRWTRAPGAWAYVSETSVEDFRVALGERGIVVEQDQIHLMGVSVSQSDTTIVFPTEFGLLERFSEDLSILVPLQEGLPRGAIAQVTISAVERNYSNWQRGGAFNPSGQVRVPSLRGDGTGYFGAAVVRTLTMWSPPRADRQPTQDPPCR